jgi:polyketide synthase PksN
VDELAALGAHASYRALDLADGAAVRALVDEIVAGHGALHGIVHSAGVLRDSFLHLKTAQECDAVLAPKVQGLMHLDAATAGLDLEVVLLFSSNAGATGNVGQADYAAANAFMDHYAGYRNTLAACGQRRGRALSLNWPLWEEGGMRMDAASLQRLQAGGLAPLATGAGIDALYRAWASGQDRVMVVAGRVDQLRRGLEGARKDAGRPAALAAPVDADQGALLEKVRTALTRMVSSLLKVQAQDIDGDAELSEFGFDSILLTEFGNMLTAQLQVALSPTIFFEYQTLNQFAGYLVAEHGAALAARFATGTVSVAAPARTASV